MLGIVSDSLLFVYKKIFLIFHWKTYYNFIIFYYIFTYIIQLKSYNYLIPRTFHFHVRFYAFLFLTILANDQKSVDVINKAIKQFSDYTCLKWVPKGSTEAAKASYSTYIEFFSERYVLYSVLDETVEYLLFLLVYW